VPVRVAQKRPVAHGWTTVFGFTDETALCTCELTEPIDFLA
jgi:hypothetical protein